MLWYVPLLSATVGGLLALTGIWVKLRLDRAAEEKRASAIVRNEIIDLARHYDRNVSRLRAMIYNLVEQDRWPDIVHIEKLNWPEDTFLFTVDSIRNSRPAAVEQIYKTRLRIRNANLDAEAALRAYQTGDKVLFAKALSFVEGRHSRIEKLALGMLGKEQVEKASPDENERAEFERATDMLFFDRPLIATIAETKQPA